MQTETTARLTTLTPTEKTLYDLLRHGLRVHKTEMFKALDMIGDEHDHRTLYCHIKNMRPKLSNLGLRILVENYQRRNFYVLVRNLMSSNE